MNEHPGMQPVIVRPQKPLPEPLQPLPHDASVMPAGLSANSIGLGERTNTMRRGVLIGLALLLIVVLGIGARQYIKSREPLKPKTIVNGAYEYTVLFYKDAEPVNLAAGQGFAYGDKARLIAMPTDEAVDAACDKLNTKKDIWRETFRVQVGGVERPVCRLGTGIFAVTFFASKAEHLLQISYTAPSLVNPNDVRKIIESVQVRLQ
jgi:hypothetical protein